MAITEYFNNTNYKNYTKFTQENNLTLDDDIIVVQDISAEDMIKMDRLEILSKKIYPTEAEKSEMTQLKVDLITYMPTANTINKIGGMLYGMQVYLKEGVVIFINQQKQELIDIVNNHKYMGVYVPLTNYTQGNMVMFDGYGFISKVNENIGHTPNKEAIDDGYWIRFTIKGEKGDPSLNISIKKGADGSGNFDNTITYNTGDACIYDHRLYYCIKDGTVGINPTDTTKWAFGEKIWIGTTSPTDHSVVWWDTTVGQNVFKRYSDNNVWVAQNVKASDITIVDSSNLYVSNNVESALTEVMNKVNNIDLTASKVTVVDSSNLYNGANAETCFAEVMNKVNVAQARADSAFTSANNWKTSIAGVVGGNITSSNTFTEIANEVQADKNILASNLVAKGVSASSGDTLRNLSGLVNNISLSSMGGKKFKSGQASSSNSSPSIIFTRKDGSTSSLNNYITVTGLDFKPDIIITWYAGNGSYSPNFYAYCYSITGSIYSDPIASNAFNLSDKIIYGGFTLSGYPYGLPVYWQAIGS